MWEKVDLKDEEFFPKLSKHLEQVNELDVGVFPALKEEFTEFLRYKIFKRE